MFGSKIGDTRVFPVTLKIAITFTLFILVSNIATNYINLMFNRAELIKQTRQLLVKDLKSLYNNAKNRYEIYKYTLEEESSISNISRQALNELKGKQSIALGINTNGTFLFQASKDVSPQAAFTDLKNLTLMNDNLRKGVEDGVVTLTYNKQKYMAIYKYNPDWNTFLVRGEELNEFYSESRKIFGTVSIIILVVTVLMALVGMFMLNYILRFVGVITHRIMNMTKNMQLELINMTGAANDDVTFLGMAFNSLSSMINNLLGIFRKFVNKDTALKAYRERHIKLEGSRKELTMLFSDIKGFTYMTETLGNDIIKLLNLHYDQAIREILHEDGIIGSIIGDALLAVYGALEDRGSNDKSIQAVRSAYALQEVARSLRVRMHEIKEQIVAERGALTDAEERVYKAVLLEIGVGIDGGHVFYGNIGSNERMTNTVIGDNVNSASRLEGLTRIYKIPVIVSEFIKEDIEKNNPDSGLHFIEIDQVQVKGKTIGKRIYWPILDENYSSQVAEELKGFSTGLDYYYKGDWKTALTHFKKCSLPLVDVFKDRTKNYKCPEDWKGIWTMKTK